MKNVHARITALLLSCLLVSGCINLSELVQPAPEMNYYTMEYETPPMDDVQPLQIVIGVDEFAAAPLYASRDMIYKKKDFLVAAYVYHRWQTLPSDMVSYMLARDIRNTGRFKGVYGPDNQTHVSCIIEGCVEKFLENDVPEDWQAELALSITLKDLSPAETEDGILFQRKYETSQPCIRNNPRAFAEAMSLAMKRLSTAIITDVHEALKEE